MRQKLSRHRIYAWNAPCDGIEITNDETEADIIIVNTCCFINDAKEESVNTILEMAEYKKTGPLKALIVTGCLAQRYKEEIKTEIPEVDAILGTNSYEDIVKAVHEALGGTFYENFKTLEGRRLTYKAKRDQPVAIRIFKDLQRAVINAVLTVSFHISAAITAVYRWKI